MKKPLHTFIGSIVLIFGLIPTTSAQCWQQLGPDFNGEGEYDNAGYSLAISSDGLTIAYGAPQSNFNFGKTKVFTWDGSNWLQKGTDLVGTSLYEQNGLSIDMSADGNTIIIGSPHNSDSLQNGGAIEVYHWDGNDWLQHGNTIYGTQSGLSFGKAVDISDDGTTIVCGAPFLSIDANTWSTLGLARVYRFNSGTWLQVGNDFTGQAEDDWFGSDVSLNSDGNTVAISAEFSAVNGTESGYVKVFSWNTNQWVQVGDDIIGEPGETMGAAIELTSNANSLVVGAELSADAGTGKGKVVVFDLVNGLWQQRGNGVNGTSIYARFGHSAGISDDGNFIVGGAVQGNGGGSNSGQIQAYYWDGSSWQLLNEIVNGEAPQNYFGTTAVISGNGSIIAGGATGNSDVATNSGHVRVFSSCVAAITESEELSFSFYPNPSAGIVEADLGEFHHSVTIQVKNVLGQIVRQTTVFNPTVECCVTRKSGNVFY